MTLAARLADDLDAAFPDLVVRLQDGVFSGVLRLVGDRGEAEDLTQETFVRAYRALRGYEPPRLRELRIEGWLWTIALNLVRNRARDRQRRPAASALEDDVPGGGPDPEAEAVSWDGQARLVELLDGLPPATRTAVVLRHVVGLPYRDIAAAVRRPVGTVRSDVHRGLATLRERLEEVSR